MIFGAIFMALSIFLLAIYLLMKLGPHGTRQKQRRASNRIFQGKPKETSTSSVLIKKSNISAIKYVEKLLYKKSFIKKVSTRLKRAGHQMSVFVFLCTCALITAGAFIILQFKFTNALICLIGAVAIGISPFFYLKFMETRYIDKFLEQLPSAVSIISNSIKVGQSIEMAITAVCRSNLHPASTEFKAVQKEIQLGQPLATSIKKIYENIPIPDVKVFITAIIIQQEVGGNLTTILETLEKTIRERFALAREIKALSSQGVMSGRVLMAIPFVILGLWMKMDPEMINSWVKTPGGKMGAAYTAVSLIVSFFVMKKMVRIED